MGVKRSYRFAHGVNGRLIMPSNLELTGVKRSYQELLDD